MKRAASEDPTTTRPASSILGLKLDIAPPRPPTFLAPVVVGVGVGVVLVALFGVVVGKPPAFPRGDVVGVVLFIENKHEWTPPDHKTNTYAGEPGLLNDGPLPTQEESSLP